MALQTPVVSIVSVSVPQAGLYSVTLNLLVDDTSAGYDGINENVTFDFPAGATIADYTPAIIARMQQMITRYETAKTAQDSALLATAVATIQSGLVV